MGNQLVWQDRFNIGVDVIDKEHKKLFSILNKLFASKRQDEKSRWACQEGIKYFREHAMKHFAEEEVYMASISYSGFETHRLVHDNFRKNTLPSLEKELNQSNYSEEAIDHFLGVCAGWLIGHTLTEDRAITGRVESRWRELLPEEEQAEMRRMILQLLEDMFQLKARLVSECYGGEQFGKGIYYRLVYGASKEEQWEIMLVFEEKLLIQTIGSMLGAESEEMSVLVMNAARYTARQFIERIREQFLPSDLYEIKEENLLSHEQFEKRFMREKPQFSLLFDTGKGYFAFCAIAPHLIQDGMGASLTNVASIHAGNAMSEVEKYLDRNSEKQRQISRKKKLLVVDDSEDRKSVV